MIGVIKGEYRYSEFTGKIIGCAMTVHSALGNGFQEVIYQRALEIEMAEQGLSFSREHEMPIYYKERQIGSRRVDFLVDNVVSVELKAIVQLEDVHLAQAINYLEAYDLEIGLLVKFGARSLKFKRVTNKNFKQQNQGNPKNHSSDDILDAKSEAYDLEVGLLINFGARSLEFKRVTNKKFKQKIKAIPKSKKTQFRQYARRRSLRSDEFKRRRTANARRQR